jgi:hypothetical protein
MSSLSKGQKRLLFVLAIVVAYGIFDMVSNRDRYFSYYGGRRLNKIQPNNSVNVNIAEIKKTSTANAKYLHTWGDDPFYDQRFVHRRVIRQRIQTEAPLNLKAISYGENSVVMINDRVLMVGDVIQGYQIKRIEPRRVILGKGSETKILTLR